MSRLDLERRRVLLYLAAILAGLSIALAAPALAGPMEVAVLPLLRSSSS